MLVRSRRRVSRLGIEITETECSTPSPPPPHKPIIMRGTDGSNPSPSSGEFSCEPDFSLFDLPPDSCAPAPILREAAEGDRR